MAKKTTVINIRNRPLESFVYIGRPSSFGNPFVIGLDGTREEVIEKYLDWFIDQLATTRTFKAEVEALKGKVLGCFCAPESCHGDIIATYLNNDEADPVEEPKETPKEQLSFFQVRGH